MAALLRSVATKMARAPPRLPYALEHHGRLPTSSVGLCLDSRFSTSTGASMPPPPNLRGPPTYNKKVPSGSVWDSFIGGFISAAPLTAYGMVFGTFTFTYFYAIPRWDRINAKLDAFNEKLKLQQNERRNTALNSLGSQIEGRDVVGEFSKGQRIQASDISLMTR